MRLKSRLLLFPWWLFLVVAGAVFFTIRNVVPAFLPDPDRFPWNLYINMAEPLAWFGAIPWALLAGVLFLRRRQRQKLLDRQKDIESIRQLSWQEFEVLCGEMFCRQGFQVQETEDGPDGGVDLVLRRGGETRLVQCKRWRNTKVGVREIRELFGLVAAHRAAGGIFVTSGDYTKEALAFARSKPIDMIDGGRLAEMIRQVQPVVPPAEKRPQVRPPESGPRCPKCGAPMVLRTAKRGRNAGKSFLGCRNFPKCRGILPV